MPSPFDTESLEAIIGRHRPDLDEPIEFQPIRTGKFNTSYFVQADSEELVLRIAPPDDAIFVFYEAKMMRQEPEIHELVRAETDVPVAKIWAYDDSQTIIPRDYLLMERLPGWPLTDVHGVSYDRVLRQVGRYLRQVHDLVRDQYGYLGAHHPMLPQSTWAEAFERMWNKMIDDIVAVGDYDPDESTLMRQLLDQHLDIFDRPVPASLLHMDIWHQNILVDRTGTVTGIVDWDRALWGDPEIEFAVLDYCGISEPAFWRGYGKTRDESPAARLRQVFYLLYELQKYIVIRHGRGHDRARALQYKRQVMDIVRHHLLN
jgi:aminoglycoside phosphotransferase (APT) family kinase protein